MTITYVDGNGATYVGGGTIDHPIPAGASAGNRITLFVNVFDQTGGSFTATGFTTVDNQNNALGTTWQNLVFTKILSGGDITAGTVRVIVVAQYTSLGALVHTCTAGEDWSTSVKSYNSSASSSAPTGLSLTVANAGSVLCWAHTGYIQPLTVAPSGMTSRVSNYDGVCNLYTEAVGTGATGNKIGTLGSVDQYSVGMYVLGPTVSPPNLVSLDPADNATNVPVNTDLELEFDEAVQAGAGDVAIFSFTPPSTAPAPATAGRTTANTGTGDTTTFNVPLSTPTGGWVDDDIIVVFAAKDDDDAITTAPPTNWKLGYTTATGTAARSIGIWRRVPSSFSDTTVQLVGDSESWVARLVVVRGADNQTDPFFATPATGTSAAADPPNAVFPWGADPTFVLAYVGGDGNGSASAYPSGYTQTGTGNSGHTTTGSRSWQAYCELTSTTAGSANPAAFTNTNSAWVAVTVGFRGAATRTLVETIDITDGGQVTFASDTVTIDPSVTLAASTLHYIHVDSGAIEAADDSAPWAGFQDETSWSFTTAAGGGSTYDRGSDETVAVTDALATATDYVRSAADTASATDAISVEVSKGVSDTVSVTDATATGVDYGRTLSDTAGLTDALFTETDYVRTGSDTASVTDAVAAGLEADRSASDSATVSDAASIEVTKGVSDSVSVTDALAVGAEFGRVLSDTASVTDALAADTVYGRDAADTASLSDSASIEVTKGVSDTVSVTDSAATGIEYDRGLSDSVSATDAGATALEYARGVADTATVTDESEAELSTGSQTFDVEVDDVVDATDAVVTALEFGRAASDAASVTDSLAADTSYVRSTADTVAISDEVEATVAGFADIVLSDSVAVTDELAAATSYVRSASDAAAISDQLLVETTFPQDAISVTDTAVTGLEYGRAPSDAAVATDTASTSLAYARSVSDSATVADTAAARLEAAREASDAASVADAVAISIAFGVQVADSCSASDTLTTWADYRRAVADTVATSDDVSASIVFGADVIVVEAEDTLVVADSVIATKRVVATTPRGRTLEMPVAARSLTLGAANRTLRL